MTIATKLTLFRIVCIPFFVLAFCWRTPTSPLAGDWGKIIAAIIFILAAISDYYDGYLARQYQQITNFGRFMDPIADKLLVSTALILMVEYHNLTFTAGYIAAIIVAREFAVTGLRLVCAEKGKVIEASTSGKLKTTTQLTAIITALALLSLQIIFETYQYSGLAESLARFYSPTIQLLMYIAAISTVYSGYEYFKKNWHLLE